MGSTILWLFSLFLAAHLQDPSGAQSISRSDLADFKDLLERIESQVVSAEKDEETERDLKEANEEPVGDADQLISPWVGDSSRPTSEGGIGHANWPPLKRVPAAAARSKLGGFFSGPRRLSNCFGQRLDRIGSVSGLGCKSGFGRPWPRR